MSEWKPIKTAPKDGTRVLVFDPDDARPYVAWFVSYGSFGDWVWGTYIDGDEQTLGEVDQECRPTHWMPLPEPPTT